MSVHLTKFKLAIFSAIFKPHFKYVWFLEIGFFVIVQHFTSYISVSRNICSNSAGITSNQLFSFPERFVQIHWEQPQISYFYFLKDCTLYMHCTLYKYIRCCIIKSSCQVTSIASINYKNFGFVSVI